MFIYAIVLTNIFSLKSVKDVMEDIKKRTLLGFFGGRRSWKPWMPGVAEDYYGRGIRNVLFEAFDNDQDIFVRNHIPHDEYVT